MVTRRRRFALPRRWPVAFAALAALSQVLFPVGIPSARAQVVIPETQLEQVSVDNAGLVGNDDSVDPFISADGRWVAFASRAHNLPGANPTGPTFQIYVHDRVLHTTTRISPPDPMGCSDCWVGDAAPSLSENATRVAYETNKPLLASDANTDFDVYVQDISHGPDGAITGAGAPVLISRDSGGAVGGEDAQLAANGARVAFTSSSPFGYQGATRPDCCFEDFDFDADVFLADVGSANVPRLVSRRNGAPGEQANGPSAEPTISATGDYVAFTSFASDLVAAPDPLTANVYRWSAADGSVIDVSPGEGRASFEPAIAGNGARVAYTVVEPGIDVFSLSCGSSTLFLFDPSACTDNPMTLYVRPTGPGALTVSSIVFDGPSNGFSIDPPVTGHCTFVDPCRVVVTAPAPGPTAQTATLLITHNRAPADTVTAITLVVPSTAMVARPGPNARPNAAPAPAPTSAPPGRRALATPLSTLPETNGARDVYVTDLTNPNAPTVEWVTERLPSCAQGVDPCHRDASRPAISQDGVAVAWVSSSPDFVAPDEEFSEDIFVRDMLRGPGGDPAPGPIRRVPRPFVGEDTVPEDPTLSRDGALVAFAAFIDDSVMARPGPGPAAALGPNPSPPPTLGPPVPASLLRRAAAPTPLAGPARAAPAGATRLAAPIQPTESEQVYVALFPSATTFTPTTQEFGTLPLNPATSPSQTFTLTNLGPGPVAVTGVSLIDGDTGDFEITGGTCVAGTTLHQNQSCTVLVRFRPTVAGSRTVILRVDDLNGTTPGGETSTLHGTGSNSPSAAFKINNTNGDQSTTLTFGTVNVGASSAAQTVTIQNTSSSDTYTVGPLTLAGTNPSDYAILNNGCTGVALAPNATCTFHVVFRPSNVGTRTASIEGTIGPTGGLQTPFLIGLTGTGAIVTPTSAPGTASAEVSPKPLTWGDIPVGSPSAPKDLTVKNTGTAPLTIVSAKVTLGGAEYVITGDQCSGKTLAPGATCTITLVFTPSAAGDRAGELTIVSSAGTTKATLGGKGVGLAVAIDPNPVDFGSVAVGDEAPEKVVTLTIPGVVAPPNGTFAISGANAGDFHINSRECTAALPEGTKCVVRLGFKPSEAGERTANLVGTFGASLTPFSVTLKGAGGVPVPSIAPSPVEFGSVLLGAVSGEVTVTVANKGDGKLTPGAAAITGEHAADFTFVADNCNGKTLLKDQSCTVVLRFSPASAGARAATLTVPGVGEVGLTGTGGTAAAAPSPSPSPGASPTPTPTTTPAPGASTPAPGTPTPAGATPGATPAGAPTIRLSRPLGQPGEVITVEGSGFRPNAQVQLRWLLNPLDPQGRVIALTTVTTDASGAFAAVPAVIFLNDTAGPRVMDASAGADQSASAPFLVVPATMQRSDNAALSAGRTQLLYRR